MAIIYSNSPDVVNLCNWDPIFQKIVSLVGDIPCKLYVDPYHFLMNTIIGQMLSNKVAAVIRDRFLELCQGNVVPEIVMKLSLEELKFIGISNQKGNAILKITNTYLNDPSFFTNLNHCTDTEVIDYLIKLPCIGPWSAKMYLIFVLNRPNVVPFEDVAFIQAYKWAYSTDVSPKSILKQSNQWRGQSSLVARYLYQALDRGFTKHPF